MDHSLCLTLSCLQRMARSLVLVAAADSGQQKYLHLFLDGHFQQTMKWQLVFFRTTTHVSTTVFEKQNKHLTGSKVTICETHLLTLLLNSGEVCLAKLYLLLESLKFNWKINQVFSKIPAEKQNIFKLCFFSHFHYKCIHNMLF